MLAKQAYSKLQFDFPQLECEELLALESEVGLLRETRRPRAERDPCRRTRTRSAPGCARCAPLDSHESVVGTNVKSTTRVSWAVAEGRAARLRHPWGCALNGGGRAEPASGGRVRGVCMCAQFRERLDKGALPAALPLTQRLLFNLVEGARGTPAPAAPVRTRSPLSQSPPLPP